jgi:hypothetical protein
MAFCDITTDFYTLVREKQHALPESKRRKTTNTRPDNALGKEYIAEAYNIVSKGPS